MGLKEIIENMRERKKDKKELIRKMDEQLKVEELLQERRKSSNERELERFWKEDKEERIKLQLEEMRKKRDKDIKFNHNPLNAKNIMKSQWEVMKEKNMFSKKSNMFSNSESILKNNPKLLKGGMKLIK
jgi:hypothetical protein